MKSLKNMTFLLGCMFLFISGCGGGGGGGGGGTPISTKSATLVLSYLKANAADQIGGFDISITLPAGATVKLDGSGVPLSTSVFLSGEFAGIILDTAGVTYSDASATQKKLVISAGNFARLTAQQGGFLTVVCDVPVAYVPNVNDVLIEPVTPPDIFTSQSVSGGAGITVSVTATFN